MGSAQLPGPVMLDLKGVELEPAERELLQHPNVGGVIYFARNYQDTVQMTELSQHIRALRPELLIAVDQEGGRVQRFREGFTILPAMARLGELFTVNPAQAKDRAAELAWLMAIELRAVGVDISFAPVLDLDYGGSEVIGDRAFHADPEVVIALAEAFIQGMHRAGMAATGKHFPGHGYVAEDSHIAKPIDTRTIEAMWASDLRPFVHLAQSGLDALMLAHVIYSCVDALPAGFSPIWIEQILRHRLRFDGAVLSDDLSMSAADIGGSMLERADVGLAAGCDMVLICNNAPAAVSVVEHLVPPRAWSPRRLQALRGRDYPKPLAADCALARANAAKLLAGECAVNSGVM